MSFKTWFSSLNSPRRHTRKATRRSKSRLSARRTFFESLEDRQLLAADLTGGGIPALYAESQPGVPADPNLTLSDSNAGAMLNTATVSIDNFVATEDLLEFTNQNGIRGNYNTSTGELSLSGTASVTDYQTALRSVTYRNTNDNPDTTPRSISFTVVGGNVLANPENGHFYEYVRAPSIRWDVARDTAASSSLFGMQGYLATITSAAENAFAQSKLGGSGWIGASDAAADKVWRWVTGPEGLEDSGRGRHFWTQPTNGVGGSPVGGEYANWATNEPNDYPDRAAGREDYGHFFANGTWNDYSIANSAIQGYVVEYGGMPGDPKLSLTSSNVVNIFAALDDVAATDEDTAVTIDVLQNDTVSPGGTLAIVSVSTPNFGTAVIDDNGTPGISDDDKIVYTPSPNDNGTATFKYIVADSLGNQAYATVTVKVNPVNDPPVVDLNGTDESGIDFETIFTGSPTNITDADATLTDVDGGVIGSATAGNGNIFTVNIDGRITKIDPSTGVQTLISNGALISSARELAIDNATGDLYVADAGLRAVVKVDRDSGAETIVASGFSSLWGIAVESSGRVLVSDTNSRSILRVDPTTGAKTTVTSNLYSPYGIDVASDGTILVADNRYIRKIDPANGTMTTTPSLPFASYGVAEDASGGIISADYYNLRRVDFSTGSATSITSSTVYAYSVSVNSDGYIVTASYGLAQVKVVDGSTGSQSVLTSGGNLSGNIGIDIDGGVVYGDNIASLTVSITNLLDGADEALAVDTAGTNITASYNSGTGVLSLTGDDTAANYQAVLRTVTYNNTATSPNATPRVISIVANDGQDGSQPLAFATVILNRPPVVEDQSFAAVENSTGVRTVVATDPDLPNDELTYSISGGPDAALFTIDSETGELRFITAPDYEQPTDDGGNNVYDVEVTVTDSKNAADSGNISIEVLNEADLTGFVFADVDNDGVFDVEDAPLANVAITLIEAGTDQVFGTADDETFNTATDNDGFYGFEDVAAGKVRIIESGVPSDLADGVDTANGAPDLDTVNDQFTIEMPRTDVEAMNFAEQADHAGLSSGDTATIGYWQNKNGKALIDRLDEHGALTAWLLENFNHIFDQADFDAHGGDVGSFYKEEFFKSKLKGTPKVDAQFMAVAFATFATSSNLSNGSAADFGFKVTASGIGSTVVNVGDRGDAFDVADGTNMTILALLQATNAMTAEGADLLYDDGDGSLSDLEKSLRVLANEIYTAINEGGDL